MKKIIVTLLSVIVLACSKEDDNSIDTNQTFLEKYDGVIIKNTPFTDFTKFENIPSGEFMFTYEIDQASPETLVYYFSTNIYSYYGVGNRPFKCILNINEENHLNFAPPAVCSGPGAVPTQQVSPKKAPRRQWAYLILVASERRGSLRNKRPDLSGVSEFQKAEEKAAVSCAIRLDCRVILSTAPYPSFAQSIQPHNQQPPQEPSTSTTHTPHRISKQCRSAAPDHAPPHWRILGCFINFIHVVGD